MSRGKVRRGCPVVFFEKRCSENMQQIDRRTPMLKCDFNATLLKLHFDMGVLLSICCILPKHLFLRTLLNGCLWKVMITYLIVAFVTNRYIKWITFENHMPVVKAKKNKKQNKAKQNKTTKIKQIKFFHYATKCDLKNATVYLASLKLVVNKLRWKLFRSI